MLCEHCKTIRRVGERRGEAASYPVTPQRAVFTWGSLVPRMLSVLAAPQPRVLLLCLGAVRTDCSQEHGLCAGYALAGDREGRDDGISILFFFKFSLGEILPVTQVAPGMTYTFTWGFA